MPPKNLLSYFKRSDAKPAKEEKPVKEEKKEEKPATPGPRSPKEKAGEKRKRGALTPDSEKKKKPAKDTAKNEKVKVEKEKKETTPARKAKEKVRTPSPDSKKTKKPAPKKPAPKADQDGTEPPKKRPYFGRQGYDNSALDKGSKPSPIGDESCLEGMTFLVTGRLESMDRGDCETLIKRHGGATRTGVTKKLSYLVTGHEPGESKVAKAKELGTAKLTEDELIKLIVSKSEEKGTDAWGHRGDVDRDTWGGKSFEGKAAEEPERDVEMISVGTPPEEEVKPVRVAPPASAPSARAAPPSSAPPQKALPSSAPPLRANQSKAPTLQPLAPGAEAQLWADKYAPHSSAKVLGNSAKAAELKAWLQSWESYAKKYNPKEKGEWKSGVLISGPPGIGKTTTSLLVGRECGYEVVEFNASDHRSQKSLSEKVSIALGNKSITSMFSSQPAKRILLVMDEIGGLDRGGTTELISMLKKAKSPMILICNDKYAQKLKSLVSHCKDLPFSRPPKNQVAAYLKKLIRDHEGVDLHEMALTEAIEAAGNDLRSTLNNLQMWCRTANRLSYDAISKAKQTSLKNTDLSPFAAANLLFRSNLPWPEVQSLFFDNDLLGLFMQENYIHSGGMQGSSRIDVLGKASKAIATADIYDALIRRENKWSLGTSAAWNASYYPMKLLGRQQLNSYLPPAARQNLPAFPGYLGKLSTKNKNVRLAAGLAREVNSVENSMQGTTRDVTLEYLPVLRRKVEKLMSEDHPQDAAQMLAGYKMCKLDWDFAQDIDTFKRMKRASAHPEIHRNNKAAMTKALNKAVDSTAVRSRRGNTVATDTQGDTQDSDASGSEEPVKKPAAKATRKSAAKPAAKRSRKAATEPKTTKKRGKQGTA